MARTFVFQALALHNGLVSVVQPLLATELVFMPVLRRFWIHQSIRLITWGAAALTGVSLTMFVVAGATVWLFGERFTANATVLAVAAVAFAVMCAAVVLLTQTAPATMKADLHSGKEDERDGHGP